MSEEARKRARETLARLAARDADRELMMVEPEVETPAEDEPTLTERRRAFKAERRAAEVARRSPPPKPETKYLSVAAFHRSLELMGETFRDALEAFAKPLAAKLKRMDQRIDDEHAALIRHVDDELSAAVRDVRELNGDLSRQAERIAQKAADRSVAELRAEIRELRKELAELKAGPGNVRVLR